MSGSKLDGITTDLNTAMAQLQANVGRHSPNTPACIYLQRGDSSGDMPHVGPAVATNETRGVLVFDTLDTAGKGRDVARTYVDAYRLPTTRVRYVDTGLASARLVLEQFGRVKGGNVVLNQGDSTFTSRLGWATYDIQRAVVEGKGGARTQVKETLRGAKLSRDFLNDADSPDYRILSWLRDEKRIPLHKHILVLWGRRACDKVPMGLHPDQDHNTAMMRGLIERALYREHTVLLAGEFRRDEFPGYDVADKGGRHGSAIFLGKFWENLPGGGNRAQQVRMFYILWKALKWRSPRRGLLHCGMRSGGMDAYGFAGQPVLYLVGGADADERIGEKILAPFQAAGDRTDTYRRWRLTHAPRLRKDGAWVDAPVDEDNAYKLIGEITRRFNALDGV